MERRRIWFVVVASALLLALGASPAHATSITFYTDPAGVTSPNGPVSALAVFTMGAGTITIDVTNTQAGIKSVGQTISGLWFETKDPINLGTTSISSSSGMVVNIDRTTHSYSVVNANESPLAGWQLTTPSTTMTALTGGQPSRLIMNTDLSGGLNGSFGGQFNPFVFGTAHFVISAPYATENTRVTTVMFAFGTSGEFQAPGAPEPASLILLGTGLVGLGGLARRRLRRKN